MWPSLSLDVIQYLVVGIQWVCTRSLNLMQFLLLEEQSFCNSIYTLTLPTTQMLLISKHVNNCTFRTKTYFKIEKIIKQQLIINNKAEEIILEC